MTRATAAVVLAVAAVSVAIALAAVPGVAAAETRSAGTVVVEPGETVDGLTAYAGTVIVRGTVNGDLETYAGNVFVEGEVTGDLMAYAGNVRIAGTVGGRVVSYGGTVTLERGASVGGDFEAAAGDVVIAGAIGGDARMGGGSVLLAPTAIVQGDVVYDLGDDGTFRNEGATVGGSIREDAALDLGGPAALPRVPGWTLGVYGVLVTLTAGAVLLIAFPDASARVADRVAEEPLRTGAFGLLALLGIPLALLAVAVTIVGLPLALVGVLLYGLLVWIAAVYGRFALGAWLVSLVDRGGRWAGLLAGVIGVALLKRIPGIGGIVEFVVVLLGLGALASLGAAAYRRRHGSATGAGSEAPAPDG